MRSFCSYFAGTIVSPRATFARLLADPRRLAYGFGAILLIGAFYTLTVAGLAVSQAGIFTPAWVAIPADRYYFWESFFALPVQLVAWVLAAGLVQMLGRPLGGGGTFEGNAAALGLAMSVALLGTWIPETVGTALFLAGTLTPAEWLEITARPGFWHVFSQAYQYVAVAWLFALVMVAVAVAQRLRWWRATLVGTVTFAVVGLFMFTFIR